MRKSVNTKPRMNKYQSFIYQKRSTSVHKSVNTTQDKKYLSEEECKCAQVRKHKAAHDKSINQINQSSINHYLFIRRGVQVCASP